MSKKDWKDDLAELKIKLKSKDGNPVKERIEASKKEIVKK